MQEPGEAAQPREGETVVDLGSGGGIDVFLAARQVGLSGRVIGVDMTVSGRRRSWADLEEILRLQVLDVINMLHWALDKRRQLLPRV